MSVLRRLPIGLSFLLCLSAGLAPRAAAQTKPSVVLITIDTLRADHLPAYGASGIATPVLDRLAREGIVFEQAVTPVPLTLPAHASLMTGTYPHYHGVRDNSGYRLSPDIPTLASAFQKAGYQTAAFVASAVLDRSFGLGAGFDHYGDQFGATLQQVGVLAERRAEEVVGDALQWLTARQTSRPFFVWLHVYDPHSPYRAPGRFSASGYNGEIEYVDSQLARLMEFLDSAGLYDSSLIAVVADHGEDLEQHGEPTHGFFLYDTVMRIPWLLKLPGGGSAGTRIEEQVEIVDVDPTVRQVAGLAASPRAQGVGQLGRVLGKRSPRAEREAYGETLYPSRHFGWSPLFALRTERYKFIDAPHRELYDLQEDPGETHNLASEQSALASRLGERLKQLQDRYQGAAASETVEIDPELKARLSSLGYVTSSLGGSPETIKGADPKEKLPVYAETYRGMEAFTEGALSEALAHFQSALKKDATVPLLFDYLGSTYLAMGDLPKAIESYQKSIQLAPERAETTSNLAFAYLKAGRPKEAEAGFQLVTQLLPSDWQAWQLLGVARLQQNRVSEAEAALHRAAELSPRNREVLFNLGSVYQQQGKHLLAVETFRQLVAVAPQDAEGWNSLASSYDASGLVADAESAFQRAIAVDPGYAPAYFNYGNLFARRRELTRAEAQYRKAIQADARFALAYRNLAAVLELQGKQEEAERFKREFERLSSGS